LPPDWRRIHLMACLDIDGFLTTLREMVLTYDSIPSQRYDALVSLARMPWR